MNKDQCKELSAIIDQFSPSDGIHATAIPGIHCIKFSEVGARLPNVYNASLCVIAQGKKRVMLEDEIYQYHPSEHLVVSVDLPVLGEVTVASPEAPYLCLQIDIEQQQLAELATQARLTFDDRTFVTRGMFVGQTDSSLADSVLRLARLLEKPEDIPLLAPMICREIHYRLLTGPHGSSVAQLALNGSHMNRISRAIVAIRQNYDKPLSVQDVANQVGMSVSSFHAHFKTVTAMSPLQYQKRLRLIEARNLMVSGNLDAAGTAYRVGYESASQFSREYTRMFGNPPKRDIDMLRSQNAVAM
ncbi:MAG: AraC family transcriptional regulator N-terminal domain-containing protein [Pseudobdellovibrionaceae bacterium]